jgi:hypothetical protein
MKYTAELASYGMMHTKFHRDRGSGVRKLLEGIHMQKRRQEGDLIRLLIFLQNKESRLQ